MTPQADQRSADAVKGDVQERADAANAQGFVGIRSDPYGDDQYALASLSPPGPPDDRTPVIQPPAQDGTAPPQVPT